jgi:hypothetical protein
MVLSMEEEVGHLVFHQPTSTLSPEIGRLAMKRDELHAMDAAVATLDPIKSHNDWLRDVVAHCENNIEVGFLSDADAPSHFLQHTAWTTANRMSRPALEFVPSLLSTQKTSMLVLSFSRVYWT